VLVIVVAGACRTDELCNMLKKDVYNLNCLLRKGIINTYFFLFCLIIGLLVVLCGALACSSFSEAVNVTYELLAIGSK